eukprot:TRINITY_DN14225_c0_g1_i1.p1 TRINITY_DN14225_c0_g1~~TRINITY_DN14225_c0_g1_i1.p1  ORF type:complete len:344 (+),score=111.79 TRINITY_DN14225_c0_g1_i1:182-1213(+)
MASSGAAASQEASSAVAVQNGPAQIVWKEYTFPSGTSFRGGFLETKKEGRGFWKHPEGETYEGEYHDNRQHGWGVYDFPDTGKRYAGQWVDGMMNGDGVYTFNKEGSEYYVGMYRGDKKHTKGLYRYRLDGRVTEQEWNEGELVSEVDASPLVQLRYHARKISIEQHVDDVCRNQTHQATTDKIELEFQKRLEHKQYTFPSGAKYSGTFLGTKKHGYGVWEHPSGDSYEGNFRYNKHEGWGTYRIGKSGKHYAGAWKNGKMDGWGVYFFNDARTEYYIGTYVSDAKEGAGVYVFASGNVKFQKWEKGTLLDEVEAPNYVIDEFEEVKRQIEAYVSQASTPEKK